ncbi:MAG TPA: tRNA (adenosine(37)-N6)-threonylcarbamoyltransferase complex dimerization subunit type 1 TsaB [Patescibacteria group bacterium]|nr:tRNA (adenosine(37)-N6)-threonylcarbamoyltransferase complex dimerization subunit type 1 TsaB [Patescibacteria group bacterium]
MIILSIRTDKPEAEIALFKDDKKVDEIIWEAHRTLVETIHLRIKELLNTNSFDWADIQGIVCFKGPGSFTGLRIGLTVANTLAYGLNVPIAGSVGAKWQARAINNLLAGKNEVIIVPEYGGEANITPPKK